MTREPRTPLLKCQHLLAIDDLSPAEALSILDLAERYVEVSRQIDKRHAVLQGRTQVNLFFESSTRTQSSFELAGKRLGDEGRPPTPKRLPAAVWINPPATNATDATDPQESPEQH